MDNITLNEDQLWQLRNFIIKRGIKEADVVNEILDHFACKVEEILSNEPNIPFDRAMQLAHQSFGSSGFGPLVAQYEKQLKLTINNIFKQELKNVVSSSKIIFIFFFGVIAIPTLNILGRQFDNHWFFDLELIGLLFIVLISSIYSVIVFKKHQWIFKENSKRKNVFYLWQQQTLSKPTMPIFILLFVTPLLGKLIEPKIHTIAITVFMFVTLIRSSAKYQTYLAMENRFGIGKRN